MPLRLLAASVLILWPQGVYAAALAKLKICFFFLREAGWPHATGAETTPDQTKTSENQFCSRKRRLKFFAHKSLPYQVH